MPVTFSLRVNRSMFNRMIDMFISMIRTNTKIAGSLISVCNTTHK